MMDLLDQRRRHGLTLADLARLSGVGYRRLYMAELNDRQLTPQEAQAVKKALSEMPDSQTSEN